MPDIHDLPHCIWRCWPTSRRGNDSLRNWKESVSKETVTTLKCYNRYDEWQQGLGRVISPFWKAAIQLEFLVNEWCREAGAGLTIDIPATPLIPCHPHAKQSGEAH